MSWQEEKQARKEHYFKYEYKWKLKPCTACSGTGWYDSSDKNGNPIPCGACEGTGKERHKPELDCRDCKWMTGNPTIKSAQKCEACKNFSKYEDRLKEDK